MISLGSLIARFTNSYHINLHHNEYIVMIVSMTVIRDFIKTIFNHVKNAFNVFNISINSDKAALEVPRIDSNEKLKSSSFEGQSHNMSNNSDYGYPGTAYIGKDGQPHLCRTLNSQPCSKHGANEHIKDANGNVIQAHSQEELYAKMNTSTVNNIGLKADASTNASTVSTSETPAPDEHVITDYKKNSAMASSVYDSLTTNNVSNTTWIDNAKSDAPYWNELVQTDADALPINWDKISSLPLRTGVGFATVNNVDIDSISGEQAVELLNKDYILRRKLEAVYSSMQRRFIFDHDKKIVPSFRLARAIAYADRRLNDEIEHLNMRCEQTGVDFESSDDNDALIKEERRGIWKKESSSLNTSKKYEKERAIADNAAKGDKELADKLFNELSSYDRKWLPGDEVNKCFGVDIETTGLNEYRDYVLDVGYEYMDVNPSEPSIVHSDAVTDANSMYAESSYTPSGAYGAGRQMFGMPDDRAKLGNPVAWLTGIEPDTVAGKVPFDEDLNAQHALLAKLESAPYVAHYANYEHKHFMANVDGYAEAYRDGKIIIIDTMSMSKRWDDKTGFEDHGSNRLEDYAKRWNVISDDDSERHLGFEDTHIMLVAMKKHLKNLHDNHKGPWSELIPLHGIGGKRGGKLHK